MKTVGIIGGSGFIGSYNTQQFLAAGYQVKVSATDIAKQEKYAHLKQLPNAENLEIVSLNVENKAQLENFVKGCQIVIHGGTPFQLEVTDPQRELFDPTIKGTENFLAVIQQTEGIEKVVFIASVAAYNTNFPLPPDGKSVTDRIDENDPKFTSVESHPYAQAKFLAHQTVENFIAQHPDLSFEVASVAPVFVVGKSLSQREDSTSMGMQFLFKNKIAPNPFVQMMFDHDVLFAMVDVEDVAAAIYKVATIKGGHGKNYLLSNESYKISDITRMLNQEAPKADGAMIYRNDLATRELGMSFRPVQQALNRYAIP